jgi:hypothetical protein
VSNVQGETVQTTHIKIKRERQPADTADMVVPDELNTVLQVFVAAARKQRPKDLVLHVKQVIVS